MFTYLSSSDVLDLTSSDVLDLARNDILTMSDVVHMSRNDTHDLTMSEIQDLATSDILDHRYFAGTVLEIPVQCATSPCGVPAVCAVCGH